MQDRKVGPRSGGKGESRCIGFSTRWSFAERGSRPFIVAVTRAPTTSGTRATAGPRTAEPAEPYPRRVERSPRAALGRLAWAPRRAALGRLAWAPRRAGRTPLERAAPPRRRARPERAALPVKEEPAGRTSGGHAGSISLGGAPPETEQWTCDVKDSCGVTTVALNSCFVDTERPKSPDDCEPGEVFACIAVNLSLELSQAHLNCECIPVPPEPSLCPCPTVSEGSNPVPLDTTGEECSEGTHLCGCAVTCILK
jgi:hypothetical protein